MSKLGVVILSTLLLAGCTEGNKFKQKEIVIQDWGTVVRVSNCDAGKYSYTCRVETTKFIWGSMDITDFPYEGLEVGDKIFLETVNVGGESNTRRCRNNMCNHYRNCKSWQSCWVGIPTNIKDFHKEGQR